MFRGHNRKLNLQSKKKKRKLIQENDAGLKKD